MFVVAIVMSNTTPGGDVTPSARPPPAAPAAPAAAVPATPLTLRQAPRAGEAVAETGAEPEMEDV